MSEVPTPEQPALEATEYSRRSFLHIAFSAGAVLTLSACAERPQFIPAKPMPGSETGYDRTDDITTPEGEAKMCADVALVPARAIADTILKGANAESGNNRSYKEWTLNRAGDDLAYRWNYADGVLSVSSQGTITDADGKNPRTASYEVDMLTDMRDPKADAWEVISGHTALRRLTYIDGTVLGGVQIDHNGYGSYAPAAKLRPLGESPRRPDGTVIPTPDSERVRMELNAANAVAQKLGLPTKPVPPSLPK